MLHAFSVSPSTLFSLTVLHKILQHSRSEKESDSNVDTNGNDDDDDNTNDVEDIYDHNERNNDKDRQKSTSAIVTAAVAALNDRIKVKTCPTRRTLTRLPQE